MSQITLMEDSTIGILILKILLKYYDYYNP